MDGLILYFSLNSGNTYDNHYISHIPQGRKSQKHWILSGNVQQEEKKWRDSKVSCFRYIQDAPGIEGNEWMQKIVERDDGENLKSCGFTAPENQRSREFQFMLCLLIYCLLLFHFTFDLCRSIDEWRWITSLLLLLVIIVESVLCITSGTSRTCIFLTRKETHTYKILLRLQKDFLKVAIVWWCCLRALCQWYIKIRKDSAIPLLSISPQDRKDIHIKMIYVFITIQRTASKSWNQTRCPTARVDHEDVYIYCYIALKNDAIM